MNNWTVTMDRNQTLAERPPPRYTASKPVDMSRQPLRYARRPIYILVAYLVLLVVPWLCVCVINRKTTADPWGIIMRQDLDSYHRWIAAASFFSTVAAVMALPCVAALLAYGAVVFSQRRSKQQTLTVRQLLAISDLKWTAFVSSGQSSSYLLLATGLLLLTAVQPPLQALLMPPSSRPVYSCDSLRPLTKWDRTCDGKGQPAQMIGKDAEPVLLRESNATQIIDNVRTRMINITSADIQENLWRDDDTHMSFVTGEDQTYNDSFWVSTMPAGVTTGPLRQHSIRLSSTADCQVARREEYPASCDGYATSLQGFGISVRTCMPSNNTSPAAHGVPPRRRQDVDEVLYIDAQISTEAAESKDFLSEPAQNVTIKCVAKTTRAFFEIGNLQTGLRPSDIVEWPSDEDMAAHFHDYDWQGNLITRESEDDWNRDRFYGWTSAQGPLRATTEALFGNGSYPQAVFEILSQTFPDGQLPGNATSDGDAKRAACSLPAPLRAWQLPYNSHNDDYDSWYSSIYQGCSLAELPKTLFRIAQGLQYVKVAQSTLGVGMYLSNLAVLQDAASNDAARTIYNLASTDFVAPRYSAGATIAISLLISMQAIALILLVCYIYSLPTWTDTLDAFAMMRLGAHLRDSVDFPFLGRASREEMGVLDETDGLLGVVVVRGAVGRSEEDLELAALASSSSAQRDETSAHQYASVSPLSPTSTVSSRVPLSPATHTSHVVDATRPGMPTSELSEYLQGAPPASPTTTTITTTTTVSSPRSPSPPPPYLPARSSNRDQPAGGPFELGLGASGLITRALWERYRPR
ncbi:hypothetical protein CORC01_10917 [Colletotrichum orchidophilum]|uniref:Uncharacterized protein n=1 Tax=Colletotrichum orchidophilum TaxID=1209926 RepID=A0A1G4AXD0_9PEZI|nr:uncharacterized protein CORC01_10917 [Colletotrichum orchidophilum]OHE93791.1 hypothetical protein CORC01_10917 [Colletotrichum orchidophilum]